MTKVIKTIIEQKSKPMLKNIIAVLLLILTSQFSWAISASVNFAVYQDLENEKSYIEIYTHIVGQSVVFTIMEDNINYQSKIQSTIIIKKGEKVINFKKYILGSPLTTKKIDFSDLARMYLPEGEYSLEIELLDLNDETNKFAYNKAIIIKKQKLSTLRLLSSIEKSDEESLFAKNGVVMESLAYDRYFDNQHTLSSYIELYPSSDQEYSYVKYSITNKDRTILTKIKRYKNQKTVPCLIQFDISKIPSDEYIFKASLINKDESVIEEQNIEFTRTNPLADMKIEMGESDLYQTSFVQKIKKNELDYHLKAILPIASSLERKILSKAINNFDFSIKRYALYEYWKRNTKGTNTKAQFEGYMKVARAVDKKYYSGFSYGFDSDRGRIFLKYGKPSNSIVVTNEPTAPPYEIWVYDYMEETHENNVRFVFYSPSLTDDYLLLHSTCKDEYSNNRWEHELYKNAPKDLEGNSLEGGSVKDNWNRKARYYFDNL